MPHLPTLPYRVLSVRLPLQAPLASLSLQNVGLSVHACRAVAELLAAPGSLRRLQLFNNMSGDEGAGHIAGLLARAPRMEVGTRVVRKWTLGGGRGATSLRREHTRTLRPVR